VFVGNHFWNKLGVFTLPLTPTGRVEEKRPPWCLWRGFPGFEELTFGLQA
jgi:hypothetical protein